MKNLRRFKMSDERKKTTRKSKAVAPKKARQSASPKKKAVVTKSKTTPRKSNNPKGVPKKEIDIEAFEKLCAIQCTKIEICEYFRITDKTLDRIMLEHYKLSFSEVFGQKRGVGLISLRRAQYQLATEDRNPAMLIFLGKNYLSQADKKELDVRDVTDIFSVFDETDDDEPET